MESLYDKELIRLVEDFHRLKISEAVDFDKFNRIAVVHHSTAIEGGSLTEVETGILISEGLTPRGKPLVHSLMTKDHHNALNLTLEKADSKTPVSLELVQHIASLVLKHTGGIYQTALGQVDASKGEFRKGSVFIGKYSFPNYQKVPELGTSLLNYINACMAKKLIVIEQINLSFEAHFHLVSIHPFYDGNGRTSRLLMNYIQRYYGLPLSIVRSESRIDYFQAIADAREHGDLKAFVEFMKTEYIKQISMANEQEKNTNDFRPGWEKCKVD